MIYVSTIDHVIDINNKRLWNTESYINMVVDKYQIECKKNVFIMGYNTFRQLKLNNNPNFVYYILTRNHMQYPIDNYIFVDCFSKIPNNPFTNNWIIGGKSIFEQFNVCVKEVIHVQIRYESRELYFSSGQSQCINTYHLPKDIFELIKTETTMCSDMYFGKTIIVKLYYYNNKGYLDNQNHCNYNNYTVYGNIKRAVGTTFEYELTNGFPLFCVVSTNYVLNIFDELMLFLNGSSMSYNFCNKFCLLDQSYIPPTILKEANFIQENIQKLSYGIYERIDNVLIYKGFEQIRTLNYHPTLYNVSEFLVDNMRVHIHLEGSVCNTIYVTIQIYIGKLDICNDLCYVSMSLSLLLYLIVHYLNEHETENVEYVAKKVIINVGQSYYNICEEHKIPWYNYHPITFIKVKKRLCDYLNTDFMIL